jgi:hypothetical protein
MNTLDDWAASVDWRSEVRTLAYIVGSQGFTADDLRNFARLSNLPEPRNPGAILGSLVSRGELAVVSDEPSVLHSSKGRRVRRFILREVQ